MKSHCMIMIATTAAVTCSCRVPSEPGGNGAHSNPFEPVYVSDEIVSCLITAARIRYVPDPPGTDYWQTPEETAGRGAGDCEDIAIYTGQLLERRGVDARVVIGARGPAAEHGHCWVEFSENGIAYVMEPAYQMIFKRRNLPKSMYIPAHGIDPAIQKFRRYHERTGKWLNDGFRPDDGD